MGRPTTGRFSGALIAIRLFSVIRTSVINELDPYWYFGYALKNVIKKPIEAILPYSKDLEIR